MIHITSIDDARIAPYRNLKDRELAREEGRFIAEGEHILRWLLASVYPCESVLLARRRVAEIGPLLPAGVQLYVAPDELMRQIIGYKFQSGVIAVGRRRAAVTLDQVLRQAAPESRRRSTLLVLPETASAANMGSLIRIGAAFGVDALLLGERCCDPFWRQSIRVSMGTIFSLPIMRSSDLVDDLRRLRQQGGFELAAAVADDAAERLDGASRGHRLALLFGNEAQGLAPQYSSLCDRRLTIPMRRGTDSLNVAVAAGIFLYHFTRGAAVDHGGSSR